MDNIVRMFDGDSFVYVPKNNGYKHVIITVIAVRYIYIVLN